MAARRRLLPSTALDSLARRGGRLFRLAATSEVSVHDRAGIGEFARIALEEACPCSRATRGNIEVTVRVV